MTAFANAGWENTHFCRLDENRIVLLAGNQRFVLTHAAAWELADSSSKDAFDKWLTQSKLSKDLGQLVASAPTDREIPLAGEIDTTPTHSGATTLVFKKDSMLAKTLTLSPVSDGLKPDTVGATQFEEFAKALSKSPSTLLVLLADSSGSIADTKAWAAMVARLKNKSEFFIQLDSKQGLLWVTRSENASGEPAPSATSPEKADPSATTTPVEDKHTLPDYSRADALSLALLFLKGTVVLLIGVGLGFFIGARSRRPTGSKNLPEGTATSPTKFIVNSNERELIEKVRDEIRKLGWSANHVPTADEFVVGQMIDRYNGQRALTEELDRLKSYRQFKDSHDAFQAKIDAAIADSKASTAKVSEISSVLEQERSRSRTLADELKKAQAAQAAVVGESANQGKRIKELERKNVEFQQAYVELVNRTSAVCHDIVITRPRGDAWALAFAYLVDYTLANLGSARLCDDRQTFEAMLTNLARLSDAMAKSFPDRKLVIDPWKRAVKAFGEVKRPSYEQKPHPQVDSLSQIMLTLRDTGPSLSEFREFFAPSETGLHIIRPA